MKDLLPIDYDNIDALVASAFAKSRDCATAITEEILHHLKPQERTGPQRMLTTIGRREIFTDRFLSELECLLDTVTRQVLAGTTEIERFDADACRGTESAVWTQTIRTCQSADLYRIIPIIQDFHETLLAVHDVMHAEKALHQLRQAY